MAKHHILIVEDERDIAGLIKHTLERSTDSEAEVVWSGDAALKAMTPEERARLAGDSAGLWDQYRKAFVESGLNQKHRGIIAGLAKSGQTGDLPKEYEHFLSAFRS